MRLLGNTDLVFALSSTVVGLALSCPAKSQIADNAIAYRPSVDRLGVDIIHSSFDPNEKTIAIGPDGLQELAIGRFGGGLADVRFRNVNATTVEVIFDGKVDRFTVNGNIYSSADRNGSTLGYSGGYLKYIRRDGAEVGFAGPTVPVYATLPNGVKINFHYDVYTYYNSGQDGICDPNPFSQNPCQETGGSFRRLSSVTSSQGLTLSLQYESNEVIPDQLNNSWFVLVAMHATTPCTSGTPGCAAGTAGLTETFYANGQIVDQAGRVRQYVTDGSGRVTAVTEPGAPAPETTVAYTPSGKVSSVTADGVTYNYAVTTTGNTQTTVRTGPQGGTETFVINTTSHRVIATTDEANRTTQFQYDSYGRLTRTTFPEGDAIVQTLDDRGNVTERRAIAKPGSGLPDIVTTASFPAICGNPKTCNKPVWTKDAKGNQTDYTYDPTHGGVLTATLPATAAGVRPQFRYTYSAFQTGGGATVYMLTGISECRTTASCAGTADEIVTTIDYGPWASGTADTLLARTVTRRSGNNSVSASVSYTYDRFDNVETIDGPLPGTSDTTRLIYDVLQRQVGAIGPDPDGTGPLLNRAVRNSYDAQGRLVKVERGTTPGQSDTAWSSFTAIDEVQSVWDINDRKQSDRVVAGGVIQSLVQYSYDAKGRLECTAVRMNPATFSAPPANACSLGTAGSNGPDRITRLFYNSADEVVKRQVAVGTPDQTDEMTLTYTPNGQLQTLTDGEGNKTSYEYDAYGRLAKEAYPSPSTPGTSSATDYVQLTYDANGNVLQRRLRDGQLISYSYDALDRLTTMTPPSPQFPVSYSYDLQGRPTQINRPGDGVNVTMTYDALGRQLSDSQSFGGMTYQYDLAGRRTRATWSDGFYVTYDRLVTGEISAIRENGASSGVGVLATYSYNALGNRTGVTRGNGGTSSYGYDSIGRLSSIAHDLAGTTHDVTTNFSYNPASQIASLSRNNTAYAWTQHYNVDRPYGVNGLNQMTSAGSVAPGYDGRGNLTSSGATLYGYDVFNQLRSSSNGMTARYDPAGRLIELNLATSTRFFHDGPQMAAEVANPSGAIQRRYVWGDGADELVTWYEGAGTSDKRWAVADERGSVVAYTDSANAAIAINRYDEFGIPQSGNIGRFQYTGQAWLPEVGMYYYKARIYSPTLGRFLQTDPIGYGDGMNIYAYVGGDPVNGVDPSGLKCGENLHAGAADEMIVVTSTCPRPGETGVRGGGGRIRISAPLFRRL